MGRKLFASIVTILLVISMGVVFTGCKTDSSVNATTAPAATTALTAAPEATAAPEPTASEPPLELTVFCADSYMAQYPVSDNYPIILALEERTNVILEVETASVSEYTSVLNTRLASGTGFKDIMFLGTGLSQLNTIMEFGQKGIFLQTDNLIEKYCPNLKSVYSEYPQFKDLVVCPDGHMYGFTAINYNITERFLTEVVRRDWLEKAGITKLPETTQEYLDAMIAMRQNDVNENGQMDEVYGPYGFSQLCYSLPRAFGVGSTSWNVDEDGNVYYGMTSPGFKEFLEYCNEMYQEGLLNIDYITAPSWDKYFADFQNGLQVAGPNCPRALAYYKQNWGGPGVADVVFLPSLKGPSGKSLSIQSNPSARYYVLTNQCDDVPRTMKFIDFLYSEEGKDLAVWGILDEDYVINEDGSYSRSQLYNDSLAQDANYTYSRGAQFYSIVPFYVYLDVDTYIAMNESQYEVLELTTDDLRNTMSMLQANAVMAYPSIVSNVAEAQVEKDVGSEFSTYLTEECYKLIFGQESFDNWDTIVATANGLGLTELTASEQAKYNRYKARVR